MDLKGTEWEIANKAVNLQLPEFVEKMWVEKEPVVTHVKLLCWCSSRATEETTKPLLLLLSDM
jgi:hypothetical protein